MSVSGNKGKIEKAVELNMSLNYLCSWSTDEKLAVADEKVGSRSQSSSFPSLFYYNTRRICRRNAEQN